jgi:hypothetical protein
MDVLAKTESIEHWYSLLHHTFHNASGFYSSNPRVASFLTLGAAFFCYYLREVVKVSESAKQIHLLESWSTDLCNCSETETGTDLQ